jgi:DNA-binding transcriptional ArsR family regulator
VSLAPVLAALGDESRLRIVAKLCSGGPLSTARLTEGSGITRQAVTKHLHALHAAGLVRSRRRSRERLWTLELRRLEDVQRYLDQISQRWDEALSRLRSAVEE